MNRGKKVFPGTISLRFILAATMLDSVSRVSFRLALHLAARFSPGDSVLKAANRFMNGIAGGCSTMAVEGCHN